MPACSAVSCSNRREQGFLLKAFPRNKQLRSIWTAKVKRENWVPTENSVLCEVHFAEDQFEIVQGKRKLKKDAVPTIFSHAPVKKRKDPLDRNTSQKKAKLGESDAEKLCPECIIKDQHINTLQNKLNAALKKLEDERLKVLQLQKGLKTTHQVSNVNLVSNLGCVFNEDQINALKNRKIPREWSDKTVQQALAMKFSCGSNGYEALLKLNLPFPSIRTLQRKVQHNNK